MKKRTKNGSIPVAALILFFAASAGASDTPQGKQIIQSTGCTGCHKLDGQGGSVGPAFDGIGKRLEDEQIRQKLLNPPSGMPSYKHLPEEKIDAIVDYLSELK